MSDRFVTVHRTGDAVEAEIVADLLADAGYAPRVVGGAGGPFPVVPTGEVRIDVPSAQADAARRFVADEIEELRNGGDSQPDEPAPEEPRLKHIFAAGVVGICPGGAHFYARRPLVGLAILVGEATALASLVLGGGRAAAGGAVLLCGLLLVDLVGGQLAVRSWNLGARASSARQLAQGVLVLVGAGALAVAAAPLLARLPGAHHGRGAERQELRGGAVDPSGLPFPLHLDFRR